MLCRSRLPSRADARHCHQCSSPLDSTIWQLIATTNKHDYQRADSAEAVDDNSAASTLTRLSHARWGPSLAARHTLTALLVGSKMASSGGSSARYQPLPGADGALLARSFLPFDSSTTCSSLCSLLVCCPCLFTAWLKRRPVLTAVIVLSACTLVYLIARGRGASTGRLPLDVNLFLSNDSRPYTDIRKIDEAGVYQRFDDITTVMKVRTELDTAYQATYDLLTNYSQLISPLPVSSYHVTLVEVMGLKSKRSLAAYNGNVTANLYRLEQLQYEFAQQTEPITFHINHITYGASDKHKSAIILLLDADTAEDASRLQRLLTMARAVLGDELWREPMQSHMTLGYKVPKQDKEAMMCPCFQPIVDEIGEMYREVKIVCDPPILSSIHDMTAFPPV